MDQGRESRWEKDAMTVEIAYALLTATFLAALAFAVLTVPVWLFGLSSSLSPLWLRGAAVVSAGVGVWRVVRVLRGFDRGRQWGR